jgi:hypothetical protein
MFPSKYSSRFALEILGLLVKGIQPGLDPTGALGLLLATTDGQLESTLVLIGEYLVR